MELSTSVGLYRAMQRTAGAGPVPPAALGLLPDLTLETGAAMTPADLSVDFTGPGLSFALAPASDALPAGLNLSTAGLLSGTPVADVGPLNIVIRGANAHGVADSGFSLTVQDMLLTFDATLSGLTTNPTYGASAEDGVALSADASNFSAAPPSVITYQWKTVESGAIAGATGQVYTPNAGLYDGETLYCTITPDGYPPKDTDNPSVIRWVPPQAAGNPGEQFWDVGTGAQVIDMSQYATGDQLAWSVAGQGCLINPATGLLSVITDSQAIGALATVTATNSGGAAAVVFTFHIEDLAAGPGPDLSQPILNDLTDTIGLTVDEDCTIYWRRDPSATNPDPAQVIAGGGHDSGSFAVTQGANNANITFATGNDGLQEISFVAAVITNEPSLVRTVAIDIDTTAPALSISVPAAGATGVANDATPVLTFSEPISAGTGTVSLYDVTGAATFEVFDVVANAGTGAGQVEIAGSDLTIRPTAPLTGGRDYAVLIDPGALRDIAGNDFAGITSTATLGFSTGSAAVIDTDFNAAFPTAHAAVWASIQANPFNATPAHLPGETWAAYPVTVTDGGVAAAKTGNYPQIRFSVPVEIGKTYSIDADFPVGEGSWVGPLRVKLGSAINLNDFAQIDETEAGQPRVVELRGQQITATTTDLWFAVIVETNTGGVNGGNPAISMLRIEEA